MSFSGEVEGADMNAARIAGSSRGAVAMLASQASLGGEYSRPALRAATDFVDLAAAAIEEGRTRPR
jgi:hypothetical protein